MARDVFAQKYTDLVRYLDDILDDVSDGEEFFLNGIRFLLVTQQGEYEAGQILFRWNGMNFEPVTSDTIIDFQTLPRSPDRNGIEYDPRTSFDDSEKLFNYQLTQVGRFSSENGPSGGKLACVWAVRHIAKAALARWLTRTDGTAVFAHELKTRFGRTYPEEDIPAGGIIISPTLNSSDGASRRIGHVGILGPRDSTGHRLVYSNSSRKAVWKQSHTLQGWQDYYGGTKQLDVLFYPVP